MKVKSVLLLPILLISLTQISKSQSKSYIVPNTVFYLDASSSPYNQVKGGDTLYFQAGNRDYICLKNFIGSSGHPIILINSGGSVVINTTHYYGISIQNCRYIKLTGTGDPATQYGFDIQRVTNGAGMGIGSMSSDFEIDHISIQNTLIGGLYAKTDPDCTFTSTRDKFTQYNTIIHDNYIAYAGNEGMYIGSTKYDGQTINCNGRDTLLLPSMLDGVKVYNNIVKNAGWDGIQVSSAYRNCQIYNNTILFDSQAQVYAQMSGIMIGGGTKCDCYNNYICDGMGDGIDVMGFGGTRIFNNIIVNAGLAYLPGDYTNPKHGIFVSDNSVQKDSTFYIFNNNIVNPKCDGIRFSSVLSKGNLISSNAIINPGGYDYYQNGITSFKGIDSYVMIQNSATSVTLTANYFDRTGSMAGFSSPTMHAATDFILTATSPLIDAADTNPKASASFDFAQNARPQGVKSDIGAYEFMGNSAPVPFTGGTIGSAQTLCSGSTPAALTNLTSPAGYTGTLEYKWQSSTSGSTAGFNDIATSNSANYLPGNLNATTWFRRLVRVTTMPDWSTAPVSNVVCVTINPLPAANAGADRSICQNTSTQIGVAAVSGSTYSWTSSPAGCTSNLANPTVTPLVNTTYTLVETNTATGCTNSHNVVVTVNPLPAAIAGADRTICAGNSTQLGAAPVTGSTYSWTSFPVGFTSTLANPTVAPSVTTTYTLVETVTATGATNSHSVVVTVSASAAAPAPISGTKTVCIGSTTRLTDSTTGGTWSSSATSIATVSSTGVVTGVSSGTAAIIYTIANAGGCSQTASTSVTVSGPPAIPGNFTTYSTKVKLGQSNIVYTVPYVAGVSYVWNWSGRGVTITGSSNSVLVSFSLTATSGTLSVKEVNSCGAGPERGIIVLSYKGAILPAGGVPVDSSATVVSSLQTNINPLGEQNVLNIYPNPSSGPATFEFRLGENAKATLDLYSVTGQRITSLFDAQVEEGTTNTVRFDRSLPCGVYPCLLKWNGKTLSTKLMVTK